MKRFEDKMVRVVQKRECVFLSCDMCGRESDQPYNEAFEWGGVGGGEGVVEARYYIDGDSECERVDLCWDCAQALIRAIKAGKLKRTGDGHSGAITVA